MEVDAAKKKMVADRFATLVYAVVEEAINAGEIPLPAGASPAFFYEGLQGSPMIRCEWIGASRARSTSRRKPRGARINPACPPTRTRSPAPAGRLPPRFAQRKREEALKAEMRLGSTAPPRSRPRTTPVASPKRAGPRPEPTAGQSRWQRLIPATPLLAASAPS